MFTLKPLVLFTNKNHEHDKGLHGHGLYHFQNLLWPVDQWDRFYEFYTILKADSQDMTRVCLGYMYIVLVPEIPNSIPKTDRFWKGFIIEQEKTLG